MKFLPLILKNLLRKKTRSFLTIASILMPLFVICFLGTLLTTLASDPTGGKGMFRLMVRHKVSLTNWIPEAYGPKIKQVPGVVDLVKMNWFGGSYIDQSPQNQFARFSCEPEGFLRIFDEATIVGGTAQDWINDRSGVLVGELLMKKYKWKVGQKITFKGDIYPINVELTIRAVFKAPDESGVYFNHKVLEEGLPRVKGYVGWYWLKVNSVQATQTVPKQIDALFENADPPTKTETEKEMQNGFISMLGNVKLMLSSMAIAIVILILFIAANTMAMAARERVTEIAVLRTLGFQKSTILGLIVGESVCLALFGGLLGLAVFVALFPGFRTVLLYSPMAGFAAGMKIFPEVLLLGFGVAVFVGLLAGVIPAYRSSQRSIPDGLRQVG